MVNVVPREVPRPKPSGPGAPSGFGLGTSLGTTFTMIPPRLFQIMSHRILQGLLRTLDVAGQYTRATSKER